MADTFVKKPMVVVGTKDQVVAEMGANDFGIATDVSFYTAEETDAKLSGKQDKGDYATNTALSQGLAQKQDIATAINYNNITNCITQIPQDIKLELNNGTLTLKAGSKVYVPNGSDVFDIRNITTDQTYTQTTDGQYLLTVKQDTSIWGAFASTATSGTTPPAGTGTFYNTTTNSIDWYDGGTYNERHYSLPFALITVSNGAISSIDQVFNGLGYFGSTVFALPGVKGLIPNGRNADDSLKSNVLNITSVKTYTVHGTSIKEIRIANSGLHGYVGYIVSDIAPSRNFYMWYNPVENIMYDTGGGTPSPLNAAVCASVEYDGTRITSFTPKTAFHAVDYNEFKKHRIVDFREPTSSNNYTWYRKYSDGWVEQGGSYEMTIGASGTQFSISLPIAMANVRYTASVNVQGSFATSNVAQIENNTTTVLKGYAKSSNSDTRFILWQVSGMAA